VNSERRKVALIQLCSDQGYCALFRVCKFNKIPLELRMLLENPEVIKVGVSCNDDAKYLLHDYAIKVNGAFDIRFLALLASHKAEGLGKLSKSVLNIELEKHWRITCSDWEIETLSKQQIDYAAKDAFVAVEIFKKLYRGIRPNGGDPTAILQFCDKFTDISFKNKLAQMNLDPATGSNGNKLLSKQQKNIDKMLKRTYVVRGTHLYDNCYLQAPDGTLLCTCDKSKALWYVEKGLATEITREPNLTVRLNFEPAGRAVGEPGGYYLCEKENKCVVCGKDHDLIRKNIVPHEYRKYFPSVMKDKTSHDIVLLCIHCHQLSNISDIKVHRLLEEKCKAPMIMRPLNDEEIKNHVTIQRAANALAVNRAKIPKKRIEELTKVVQDAYPNDEITDEFLYDILSQRQPTAEHNPSHAYLVVEYYKSNEGLIALEKMYRQHFLDTMQPEHMPKLWDVNHNANRLAIRAVENRITSEDLKFAGVDEKLIESMQPTITVTPVESNNNNNNNSIKVVDDDSISMASFYSAAAGSAKMDQTDDERYFSDSATIASFYETIHSDTSDLTDFQSFQNSREASLNGDDSDDSTIGSPEFPTDEDTEVEEEEIIAKKL
jgi:hypothetical protein